MRIAYGFVLGVAMLLTADLPPDILPVPPELLQGGAFGILGWTAWYLLTRTIPAQTAALKDQRDAFLTYLNKRDERQKD